MGQCQVVNRSDVESDQIVVGRERKHVRAGKAPRSPQCQDRPGNLRLSTLVSPKGRSFASEYTLLPTALGRGSSGFDVQLAQRLGSGLDGSDDGGLVAVKILGKTGLTKKKQRLLMREVDIHLSMDHANIVRLLQVFDEPDKVYLVMEYCSGGTLQQQLHEKGRFAENEAACVIHQALSALSYCHGRPYGKVIHRDLKLNNFVCSHKGEVSVLKLLDFGLSRVLAPGGPLFKNGAGTLEFMAPEVLRGEQHGEACDLWSIGVMAYALLSGELPFDGTNDEECEKAVLKGNVQMTDGVWAGISDSAKGFIAALLCSNPAARPSAEAALLLPWMAAMPMQSVGVDAPPASVDVLRRLEAFATENAMRRAAAGIAIYSQVDLGGEDVEFAEEQFRSVDADGNGAISEEELTKVLQLELGIGAERCHWIFEQVDLNGDQEIQRSEFLAAVVGARLLRSNAEVDKVFKRFDFSKDGKIDPGELKGMLGESFCGRPTRHIFSELDVNGDRVVDFNEFSSMVNASTTELVHV